MIVPVRCFTCGKPIGGIFEKFQAAMDRGEQPGKVLDELGVDRYCCRALVLTHKDIIRKIAKYRV